MHKYWCGNDTKFPNQNSFSPSTVNTIVTGLVASLQLHISNFHQRKMNFISNVCPFVLGILKGRYADYFSFLIYLELENKAQQDDGPKR